VIAEVLFIAANYFIGRISEFGSPLNFFGWLFYWFHILPSVYLRELGDSLLALPAWLFQWWLMFFAGITFSHYISRKDNPRTLKIVISLFTIALVTSLGFLVNSQLWQNSNLKGEVHALANVEGYEEADKDFQAGKLKVFVISGKCSEDKFSGTNDGPFEIWIAAYYPSLPSPFDFTIERKIEAYNLHMRSKYKWSLAHTNNLKSVR
jgi:hypothetical protein